MLATVVDTAELGKTVIAALVAGVGITATFSLMIFGASRSAQMRRDDRPGAAAVFAVIAALSLVATLAGITIGMIVMLSN